MCSCSDASIVTMFDTLQTYLHNNGSCIFLSAYMTLNSKIFYIFMFVCKLEKKLALKVKNENIIKLS